MNHQTLEQDIDPIFYANREDDLVFSAKQGNLDAFSQLFNHYYPMIVAFSYRITLCHHCAQNVAQECFIKAARGISSFDGDSTFKTWIYRIASNTACDRIRKKRREVDALQQLALEHQPLKTEPPINQLSNQVKEALQKLPEKQRVAVSLVYYENLNHRDAAHIMKCAETTVSWYLLLAKRTLKKSLQGAP